MKIEPRKSVYIPGDHILITAKANPPPRYMWRNLATNVSTMSNRLHVRLSMFGKQTYAAIAYNTLFSEKVVRTERFDFTVKCASTSVTDMQSGHAHAILQHKTTLICGHYDPQLSPSVLIINAVISLDYLKIAYTVVHIIF